MQSNDAALRGLSVWAAGPLADDAIIPLLKRLSTDKSRLNLYHAWQLSECTVGSLARDAIMAAENQSSTEET
jgi:hypothetical protein